jgi:hypothetical protein
LFDFADYADGILFLQMDSDILFYQDPIDIIAAASRSSAELVDRFNEDIVDSYTWSAEQVRETLQIDLLPRINVDVGLLRRDSKAFVITRDISACRSSMKGVI